MRRLGSVMTAFETVGVAIAVLITPLAALVTVVAYPLGAAAAIPLGLAAAVAGSVPLIWLYQHPTAASDAYPDEFTDLSKRLQSARNLMETMGPVDRVERLVYGPYDPALKQRPVEAAKAAWQDADKCGSLLQAELDNHSLHWSAGSPYLRAWKHLYGMEEALICCMPHDLVVPGISNDIGRLDGSAIPRRRELTQALKDALTQLTPAPPQAGPGAQPLQAVALAPASQAVAVALPPQALALTPPPGALAVTPPPQPMAVAPAPQPVATGPTPQPMVARSTARTVRKDINVYRADQWDAMMRSRDLTMLATAFAAIGAYALLVVVAVYGRIPFSMVVAATVFLVVGGVVGLTHQVYLQVGQQSVVEDFGLSVARMLANPLVSGLVALIAVATFGTAGLKINDAVIVKPLSDWHQVFNFTANSGAIVVAVLFGFAPSLLFQWLQSRADQLQKNLQNTQSTGSTTP